MLFPSPCGVRRVGDALPEVNPMKGVIVSVPLRGKEGGGHATDECVNVLNARLFPSPCGVRRVGDLWSCQHLYSGYCFRPLAG